MEKDLLEDHSKIIIHIDLDCFYAQVEMIKNPKLRDVPLGIQQKNIVVTTNYIARQYGVTKCSLITDALQQCPNLVLVNGEDLHDYRQTSYQVTALLHTFSNLVERLGLDENFLDVSLMVDERLRNTHNIETVGNIFGDSDSCDCGCKLRIQLGTTIAQEIRDKIKSELQLTCSAGISYNKLLAKIAGGLHKPDEQTVVFTNSGIELMLSLSSVSKIPGIGYTLSGQLETVGITTVKELQNTDITTLSNILGPEKAKIIKNLSFGIDQTPVKVSGKPQSIGIEDSCRVNAENEVREKLEQLLNRLVILLTEDGRLPRTIKLTVRKYDKSKDRSNRETRQCSINPSLFNFGGKKAISEASLNKVMTTIMHLFKKLVDTNKPYHLTLLGLSFTKFLEKSSTKNLLTHFIENNIEVQSVTDIESNYMSNNFVKEISKPLTLYLENDMEPSKKKRRYESIDSPSGLPMGDLDLRSETPTDELTGASNSSAKEADTECPPDVDYNIFQELPKDLQQELWEDYKRNREREENVKVKKFKPNSILNYFNKK